MASFVLRLFATWAWQRYLLPAKLSTITKHLIFSIDYQEMRPIIPNRTVTKWSHSKNFSFCENTVAHNGSSSRRLLHIDFLHITLCCVHIVKEWLDRHPLDGKFSRGMSLLILAALVHISGQTKVWYLHQIVIAHKDISSCKIPVDEFLLRQVFLEQNE